MLRRLKCLGRTVAHVVFVGLFVLVFGLVGAKGLRDVQRWFVTVDGEVVSAAPRRSGSSKWRVGVHYTYTVDGRRLVGEGNTGERNLNRHEAARAASQLEALGVVQIHYDLREPTYSTLEPIEAGDLSVLVAAWFGLFFYLGGMVLRAGILLRWVLRPEAGGLPFRRRDGVLQLWLPRSGPYDNVFWAFGAVVGWIPLGLAAVGWLSFPLATVLGLTLGTVTSVTVWLRMRRPRLLTLDRTALQIGETGVPRRRVTRVDIETLESADAPVEHQATVLWEDGDGTVHRTRAHTFPVLEQAEDFANWLTARLGEDVALGYRE